MFDLETNICCNLTKIEYCEQAAATRPWKRGEDEKQMKMKKSTRHRYLNLPAAIIDNPHTTNYGSKSSGGGDAVIDSSGRGAASRNYL